MEKTNEQSILKEQGTEEYYIKQLEEEKKSQKLVKGKKS